MKNVSTEANLGKIFVLVGFILGFIGGAIITSVGIGLMAFFASVEFGAAFVGIFYILLGVLMLTGSIIAVFAHKAAGKGNFHRAGVLGIIGAVVGCFNIFTLIGAILCLVSREAKR